MQPISPHQTHSLGLSVDTNTQTHELNEGARQTHTGQIKQVEGKRTGEGGATTYKTSSFQFSSLIRNEWQQVKGQLSCDN